MPTRESSLCGRDEARVTTEANAGKVAATTLDTCAHRETRNDPFACELKPHRWELP